MFTNYSYNPHKDSSLILLGLANSTRNFYLTGSRFFGAYRTDSDYDFFVQDDISIGVYLTDWGGFTPIFSSQYKDSNTLSVYRFKDQKIQVDIQIVKDAALKQAIQTAFKARGIKYVTKNMWNTAYKFPPPEIDNKVIKSTEYVKGKNKVTVQELQTESNLVIESKPLEYTEFDKQLMKLYSIKVD